MTMIETTGFDMKPLYVAKDKILGMAQKGDNPQQTTLIMGCGSESEEWVINESVLAFRVKYDNA
jgi:hypothetical protein